MPRTVEDSLRRLLPTDRIRHSTSELLGVRGVDVDWGDQLVRVERKRFQAEQWLPSGPESFIRVRLYQYEGPKLDPQPRTRDGVLALLPASPLRP